MKAYFHLCQNNILSAMHVDWDPPHLGPVVLYITPIYTSSMQDFLMQGGQQK